MDQLVKNQFCATLAARGIATPGWIPSTNLPSDATVDQLKTMLLSEIEAPSGGFPKPKGCRLATYHANLLYCYYQLLSERTDLDFRAELVSRFPSKRVTEVAINTVTLSPYPYGKSAGDGQQPNGYSCRFNCSFCPNQPGVPRSYLAEEPAVMRGSAHEYHPVSQTFSRLSGLLLSGQPVDRVEVKLIGGTWSNYHPMYRQWVIYKTFEAHNRLYDPEYQLDTEEFTPDRYTSQELDRLLEQEQRSNMTAACRIIGLTVETRPDCLDDDEIAFLRRLGCTRVEIGVQHTDDDILRTNRRGHLVTHSKRALRLLKDGGFRTVIDLMPQLPGSDPEKDQAMIRTALRDPDLQADEWRLYQTEVVAHTALQEWFESGQYRPYSDEELKRVYRETLPEMPPYIRLDRLKRDLPSCHLLTAPKPGFRNEVFKALKPNPEQETGGTEPRFEMLEYQSSQAREIYLMSKRGAEVVGFCRLRLPERGEEAAWIRELGTGEVAAELVRRAEELALERNYRQMKANVGVGMRTYYQELGYQLEEHVMTKTIGPTPKEPDRGLCWYWKGLCLALVLSYTISIGLVWWWNKDPYEWDYY
jgi:ELP3 family radical SAM enzyme/protein acetyltransferase